MLSLSDANLSDDVMPGVRERRRGTRVRQSRPVKVYEPVTGRFFAGQTCDISSSGARIVLPASMPLGPGRPLSVHIGVGRGGQPLANRRQMIPARVVWIDRPTVPAGQVLEVGIEFEPTIHARLHAA